MEVRTGRHCVFILHAHLIFITKYRGKVFADIELKRLEEICHEVCRQFEVELKEFNGKEDHVHLLVNYPPKVQLSKLINSLKGVSSRRLKSEFQTIREHWICKRSGALWSPSYFAGSVGGAPLMILKQYIAQQNRPTSPP
jgi:putative transposase